MSGSPKINLKEKDVSTYVETSGKTFGALIGFATRGAVNEPTLCISKQDFINKFGTAPENFPYAHLAAYRYFDYGSALLFTRIAVPKDDVSEASGDYDDPYEGAYASSSSIKTYEQGTSASIVGTSPMNTTPGDNVSFQIKVDESELGYTNVFFQIVDETGYGVEDIVADINAEFESKNILAIASADTGGTLTITSRSTGASSSLSIKKTNDDFLLGDVLGLASDDLVESTGANGSENTDGELIVKFKEMGTVGDNFYLTLEKVWNKVTTQYDETIKVYNGDGVVEEEYSGISFDSSSDDYFVKLINETSDILEIEFETTEPSYARVLDTTIELSGGDDGIPELSDKVGATSDDIGSLTAQLYLKALDKLNNPEIYDFDILATPGNYSEVVINKALSVAESRKDFLYLVDSPNSLEYDEVANWHNGTGGYGLSTSLNSSYGALYWSWQKDFDADNGEYIDVPPSVFMFGKFAQNDIEYAPWKSPAGLERGKILGSLDYEFSPSEAERDLIYGDLNAVNPIVNFLSEGLIVWGQKTLLRELKATNRVNVRRLLIYIKKLVRKAMRGFIFEANHPDTWARATNAIRNIIEPVKQANGVSFYEVIIDSTTNTAATIDQSQMNGIISIVPVKEIEEINITFKVLSTGAVEFG